MIRRHPTVTDWRFTAALFLFTGFAESLAFGHFQAFTPLFLRQIGVPTVSITAWTGVLGVLGSVVGLPLLPLWGALAERWGRKPIILRSAIIEVVLIAIAGSAHSPYMLAFARFLSGFVLGNTGVMMALQSEVTPPKHMGLAIAWVSSGPAIGIAAGPLLGGIVASGLGLRALFYLDAGLSALSALLLLTFLHEAPRTRSTSTMSSLALQSLRDVLQLPAVRSLFIIYLLFALGVTAVQPFMPLWIHAVARRGVPALLMGPPAYLIGLVLTLGGIAMAIGTPVLGWLGDQLGSRRTLFISLLGNGVFFVLQAVPTLALLSLGQLAQGFFRGGVSANLMALLAEAAPEDRRAAVMNLSLLPQQIAWFAGPALGTALAAGIGLQGMVLVCGAMALAATPLVILLRPHAQAQGAAPPA
ncbi:MAG: MFS transporter [Thermaerobacter sp.]|nr:MFS transporter [Thermaerobacter sp.]